MYLVSGATGFVGQKLTRNFIDTGEKMRLLIRPGKESPKLKKDSALDVSITGILDTQGLRSAMRGVKTIIHLASAENDPDTSQIENVDIEGTKSIIHAAKFSGIKNIMFLSRIGADKNSSFPIFRGKAIAEQLIIESGMNYTILRITDIFGSGDNFTCDIGRSLFSASLFLPIPAGDHITIQPVWIEDILSVMNLVLDNPAFNNRIMEIGGSEFFSMTKIVRLIQNSIGRNKSTMQIASAYLRILNKWISNPRLRFPFSEKWLDLTAIDRTCSLDSLTKQFGIIPARFEQHLTYLQHLKKPENKQIRKVPI